MGKFTRLMQPFGLVRDPETQELQMRAHWFRIISSEGFTNIPEFTTESISKPDYAQLIQPADKRVGAWIARNCDAHAPYISPETNLQSAYGEYAGKVALLVLSGPSAAGVEERIARFRDHDDFYVATLNLSAHAVPDCDFHMNFEQLCPPEYFEPLDPSRTTLVSSPAARAELAEKWGGRNVYYAYMGDMRCPHDPRFQELPLLCSALATVVPALQALYHMGFSHILLTGADFAVTNPLLSPEPLKMLDLQKQMEEYAENNEIEGIAEVANDAVGLASRYVLTQQVLVAEGDWYFDGTRFDVNSPNNGKSYYNGQHLALVEGVDGKQCATLPMLHKHMLCTECCMEIIEDAGVGIYNCSEQGILNRNVENLESLLERLLYPEPALEITQGVH